MALTKENFFFVDIANWLLLINSLTFPSLIICGYYERQHDSVVNDSNLTAENSVKIKNNMVSMFRVSNILFELSWVFAGITAVYYFFAIADPISRHQTSVLIFDTFNNFIPAGLVATEFAFDNLKFHNRHLVIIGTVGLGFLVTTYRGQSQYGDYYSSLSVEHGISYILVTALSILLGLITFFGGKILSLAKERKYYCYSDLEVQLNDSTMTMSSYAQNPIAGGAKSDSSLEETKEAK